MSNGKILNDLKKMVDEGKPLNAAQYRTFMLSVAMDAQEERKQATKERGEIIKTVDDKVKYLEVKIDERPSACAQAKTNKEEIAMLRKSSKITDAVLVVGTFLAGALGITK